MKKWLSNKGLPLVLASSLVSLALAGCGAAPQPAKPIADNQKAPADTQKPADTAKPAVQPVVLKLAHQWAAPVNGAGDYRAMLAAKFAEEVEKKSNGSIKIEIYPADSLVKTTEHYSALQRGTLDMSVWVPVYSSGKLPELGITMMPGVIKDKDQAWKWIDAPIGKDYEDLVNKNGIKTLVWTWAPITIATVGNKKVVHPKDVAGLKLRGAGKDSENMLAKLGAGIVSMSSADIYNALQTKVLDSTLTSFSSFISYRLYEVVNHFMDPGDKTAIMYAMMPLVISKHTWDTKLTDDQKKVIESVSKDLQKWVIQAVEDDNKQVAKVFKDHGVDVYQITDEQMAEWYEAAQPVVKDFEGISETAKKMVEDARNVK